MTGAGQVLSAGWYSNAWWLWLLRPLEMLFRIVSWLRRLAYCSGLLSVYRAPCPVVIIGNITLGGSGKTPVVIALVEALGEHGVRAGVVSRGYGASRGQFPHIVSDTSDSADCGDEPLLIYQRTGCPCVVSPSRVDAVRSLLSQFEVDVILSDDGLQHYALARDLEIALVDASVGLGNGFCLPAGPLREPPQRLRAVDFTLYRGSEDAHCGVCYLPEALINLADGRQIAASAQALGQNVYAFAGIGQPQQFFGQLRGLGFDFQQREFPDHHVYTAADFAGLSHQTIIMTEKDAVKCHHLVGDNAWYLRISAQLPQAVVQTIMQLAKT